MDREKKRIGVVVELWPEELAALDAVAREQHRSRNRQVAAYVARGLAADTDTDTDTDTRAR